MCSVNRAYIYVGENAQAVCQEALGFAKALNCKENDENQGKPAFCGNCSSCLAFDGNNHPDTFFVTSSKKSIGAADIREQILLPMSVKPYSHKYKVFIMERAQELTPAAQNVLLKTIEEPADYGVFLFVARNTRSFLPTVLSRADIVKIHGKASGDYSETARKLAGELHENLGKADLYDAFLLYGSFDKVERKDVTGVLDLLYLKYGESGAYTECSEIVKTKQALSHNANQQLAIELLFSKLCTRT